MNEKLPNDEVRPEDRRIAVALSGGGHRACLFALGALLYLVDAGKAGQLTSIASVSGGSLANGAIAQSLDVTRAERGGLDHVAATVAGRITGAGTLFGTPWTFAYLAAVVLLGLAALVVPWLLPIAIVLKLLLFLAGALLTAWVVSMRGRVCAFAFDHSLFRPEGKSSRLAGIHMRVDHVFCATDLHAGEHVYFSGDFVYSYRFGRGQPGDIKLSTVVQASAAFPGAFPPAWLPTERHGFAGARTEADGTRKMALVDGGVYDNMADQWAQGSSARAERLGRGGSEFGGADELIVVNSSAGLDWGRLRWLRLPALGELLTLLRDKSVLYDNGNSLRRKGLVDAFRRAEHGERGIGGALVHIPQSPFLVPLAFSRGKGPQAERAASALNALRAGKGDDVEARWTEIAKANARVKTTLSKFDPTTASRLLRHAYVLAMVNLHTILGYPLLEMPEPARFDAIAAGAVGPGPKGGGETPSGGTA